MKALFCHDGPTYIDNKKKYYACVLNDELIDRYFKICDEFTLLNRLRKTKNVNGLEEIKHTKTNIIEIPNLASLKGIVFNSNKAKKIIEQEVLKADFVVARLPGFAGSYAVKLSIKHNKPYFIEMVGCPLNALSNHSFKGKLIAPIMYIYTRTILKKSAYTIYVTNSFLQKRYPSKGINFGCSDVDISVNQKALTSRLERINESNNKLILGSLGTLNMKYKGFDIVIKALSQINKKGEIKYIYKIMGNGDDNWLRKVIKKYNAEDYIEIFKPVPHNKVFKWLDEEIDIYVQPSRTEGMPRALIEAMSRACPCIGSNVGGIPELLDKKYIFNKGKYKELINILKRFSQQDMTEQSKINFEKSKEFSKESLYNKKMSFYEKFMNNNF